MCVGKPVMTTDVIWEGYFTYPAHELFTVSQNNMTKINNEIKKCIILLALTFILQTTILDSNINCITSFIWQIQINLWYVSIGIDMIRRAHHVDLSKWWELKYLYLEVHANKNPLSAGFSLIKKSLRYHSARCMYGVDRKVESENDLAWASDHGRLNPDTVGNSLDCMVIVQYLVKPPYLAQTSKTRRAISPVPWRYIDTLVTF